MKSGQTHRFAFMALLALAACTRGGDEDPSVVLERAASKAGQLQSAAFEADFTYETPDGISAKGTLRGVLTEGGRQSSFTLNADLLVPQDGFDPTVRINADVIVAGENEAYLKLSALDGSVPLLPGIGLLDESMLDRWLSVGQATLTGSAISPDPSFIAMQTRVLAVTNDRSYEDVDDERCYAYDVTIDPAKMLSFLERTAAEQGQAFDRVAAEAFIASYDARGTIWIDAATSVIRRITWIFEPVDEALGASASLSVHLSRHNEPVEITPPPDAEPFSDALPGSSLPAL